MRLATYDAIIARAERSAASSPASYRLWVRFFAGIGFSVASLAMFSGLLLLLVAISIVVFSYATGNLGETALKMAGVIGFFGISLTWSVAKGFVLGFPPAPGITLKKEDAGELFDEVERLRRVLQVAPVHRIILTNDLNAMLYQRPRLGIFGWYDNALILGLPLLRQFSVDEARSIIAHELGHLHGEHGRSGAKIYRLRQTWQTLIERGGSKLLGRFMQWYVPRFNAFTFVLARMQEREADKLAAELCSPAATGSALVRIHLIGRQYPQFWDRLSVIAAHEPHAPSDIYDRLNTALYQPSPDVNRWLREEMTRTNNRQDTHPCLNERLQLVGYTFRGAVPAAPQVGNSAADHWLDNPTGMAAAFNAKWQADHADDWQRTHEKGARHLVKRDALQSRCLEDNFTRDEHWELASLTHHFDGAEPARPTLTALIARFPDHPPALYRLGADLLYEGDARGIPFLEASMFYDHDAVAPGCIVLRDFADAYGHRELVADVERRLESHTDLESSADSERTTIPDISAILPHGLQEQQIALVSNSLITHEDVIAADVARVDMRLLPERTHYLVVLHLATSWWSSREEDADQKLISAVMSTMVLPGTCLIVLAHQQQILAQALTANQQARVFTRN